MIEEILSNEIIVLSYGEIALKKGRRHLFEQKLIKNLQKALKGKHCRQISCLRGRITITPGDHCPVNEVISIASKTFGVVAVQRAKKVESDIEKIEKEVTQLIENHPLRNTPKTFAVISRRPWKEFPLKSIDICRRLGGIISQLCPQWSVDLSDPDIECFLEVHKQATFLSTEKTPGPGGLPIGTAGKVSLLLSGGIDSPVAGHMMQKRGARLVAFYFHSHPYTGDQALNKVKDLARILKANQHEMGLYLIHLTEIQEAIRDHCNPKYAVILTRRMMMRLAQIYTIRKRAKGIVTGENLGQVASQTLENMACINACTKIPVYRPLIGFDKQEIISLSHKIGSFEISIRPYEDCCSLFVDPHPITDAKLIDVEEEEKKLNIEELVGNAIKKSYRVDYE